VEVVVELELALCALASELAVGAISLDRGLFPGSAFTFRFVLSASLIRLLLVPIDDTLEELLVPRPMDIIEEDDDADAERDVIRDPEDEATLPLVALELTEPLLLELTRFWPEAAPTTFPVAVRFELATESGRVPVEGAVEGRVNLRAESEGASSPPCLLSMVDVLVGKEAVGTGFLVFAGRGGRHFLLDLGFSMALLALVMTLFPDPTPLKTVCIIDFAEDRNPNRDVKVGFTPTSKRSASEQTC
jgi:hypothetical protein